MLISPVQVGRGSLAAAELELELELGRPLGDSLNAPLVGQAVVKYSALTEPVTTNAPLDLAIAPAAVAAVLRLTGAARRVVAVVLLASPQGIHFDKALVGC